MTHTNADTGVWFEPTWDEARKAYDRLADEIGDWQGVPIPIPGMPLTLCDGHPFASHYAYLERKGQEDVEIVTGGPPFGDEDLAVEEVVNLWYSHREQAIIRVWRRTVEGQPDRYFATKTLRSPPMARLNLWLQSIAVSDAWDLAAEEKAQDKLRGLLNERQWRHYVLTGAFLESSSRSQLYYVFRRLRPTLALTPRGKDGVRGNQMLCLGALCLHPVGYYQRSWAGCMVPTDDVIAHLLMMRGDEAYFWGKANLHEPWESESGL